jgi:hypothetical protein
MKTLDINTENKAKEHVNKKYKQEKIEDITAKKKNLPTGIYMLYIL